MEQQDATQEELALHSAGETLRTAREARGLSREDIAASTRIAERHLRAIEEDRFSDLASRTYAVGFARAYARAVGLDERRIAEHVRQQLDAEADAHPRPQQETFEPGDPARVPPPRLAWIAGAVVAAVLIALIFFWRGYQAPEAELPSLIAQKEAEAQKAASPAPAAATPAVTANAPVVFTANEANIWVKFYDANGVQLFQKQMAQGERYVVPADAQGPQLWTARPDALTITVDGKPVPRLAERPITMKDVPVTAQALLARAGVGTPAATPPSATAPAAAPAAAPVTAPLTRSAPPAGAPVTAAAAPREARRQPASSARAQAAMPIPDETVSPVSAEQRLTGPVSTDPMSTDSATPSTASP